MSTESDAPAARDWKESAGRAWVKTLDFMGKAQDEKTGLLAGLVVFLVGLLATAPLYWVWGLPGRLIEGIVARNVSGDCAATSSGFSGFFCDAKLAAYALFGAFVVALTLFLLRRAIRGGLLKLFDRVPSQMAFLPVPVVAAIAFTMSWAAVEFHFFRRPGLVMDGFFPAVFAFLTHVTIRYGPWLQDKGAKLLEQRDRIPRGWRFVVLFAIPLVIGLALPIRTPIRDQLAVIFAVLGGWLLLMPRQGDALSGLQQAAAGRLRPPKQAVAAGIVLLALLTVPVVQAYGHCQAEGWFTEDWLACEASHHNATFTAGTGIAGALSWLVGISILPPSNGRPSSTPSTPPAPDAAPANIEAAAPEPEPSEMPETPDADVVSDEPAPEVPPPGVAAEPLEEPAGDAGNVPPPDSDGESEPTATEPIVVEETEPDELDEPADQTSPVQDTEPPTESSPEAPAQQPTPAESPSAPEAVAPPAGSTGDDATRVADALYGAATDGREALEDALGTANEVATTLGDFASGMKDDLDDIKDRVEQVGGWFSGLLGGLSDAAQGALNQFTEGLETAAGIAGDVADKAGAVTDKIGEIVGITDKVQDYMETFEETSQQVDAYGGLAPEARDTLVTIRMASKGWGDAVNTFRDGVTAPVGAVFGDDAQEAVNSFVPVGEFVEGVGEMTVNAVKNVSPTARSGMSDAELEDIGLPARKWVWPWD